MSRIVKILAISAGVSAAVVVTAGVVIGLWLDPNNYKDDIQHLAAEQGIDLQLRGPIGWQLWPSLALSLEDVQLASSLTPERPLAQLQQLAVVVELVPLLQRHIRVAALEVNGAEFTIDRNKQGRSNWEIKAVTAKSAPATATNSKLAANQSSTVAVTARTSADSAAAPMDLAIEKISFNNVSMRYHDLISGQHAELADLNVEVRDMNQQGDLFPVTLSTDVQALNDLPGLKLALEGNVGLQQQQMQLQPLSLTLSPLAGNAVPLQLTLTGKLGLQELDMDIQLALASFNARKWLEALKISVNTADQDVLTTIELAGHVTGKGEVLKLTGLQATVDDTHIQGEIGYNQPGQLAIQASMRVDKLNADRYLPASVGEDAASGAQAKNMGSDQTAVVNAAGRSTKGNAQSASAGETPLPLASLRELRLQLTLTIGELQLVKAHLADVALQVRSHDGVAQLQQFGFKGYSGTVASSGSLDSRGSQARLHVQGDINGIDLQGLLGDTLDEKRLQGVASIKFNGDSVGLTAGELQRALTAGIQLQAKSLQVNNLDVERDLCELAETLGGASVAGKTWKGYTQLQDVSGDFALREQVVNVKSLAAGMEALTVAARGDVDLAAKKFDMPVDARISGTRDATLACQIRDRWRNQDLPLRCRGSFDTIGARTCLPDKERLAVLLKQQGQKEVEQKASDKLREKLGDEKGKQVEGLLRGIFGR